MESRLSLIVRFLTHFCDTTEVCVIKPNHSVGRVSDQVVQIREAVNRYFITYFACESINQMKIDDLEAFGVNAPVIFGLLDELGYYLTKHAEESTAKFIERHQAYYSFESLGAEIGQIQTVKMAASQLFFALHFVMQKMCPSRTEKKLKAAAAQSIVDHTLIDQLLRQAFIKERKATESEVASDDILDQIKSFFTEALNHTAELPETLGEEAVSPVAIADRGAVAALQTQAIASESIALKEPARPALGETQASEPKSRTQKTFRMNHRTPIAREKVVSQRLSQERLVRLGAQNRKDKGFKRAVVGCPFKSS